MSDPVNHPAHYTSGPMEVIDIIDMAVADPESAYHSNIIKYILRYRHKGGVQDLKKARWFLDRLITRLETSGGG